MRSVRTMAFVVLAVLLLVPGWSGAERLPLLRAGPITITARPVPLRSGRPDDRRLGRLTYLGGVELTNRDRTFGGFSAMRVAGDRFLMLSDGGGIVRFRMHGWRITDASAADLGEGPGTGWEKRDRDSESLATLPDGSILVGYERANAIWRYTPDLSRALAMTRPRGMRDWSSNSGAEAMARMPDGSVLVLSESHVVPGRRGFSALRFAGDPTARSTARFGFRYVPPAGFRVTDAAALPDGRLLVLTRRARLRDLFTARLQIADPRRLRPGQVVVGRTIAAFEGDVVHDNLEALSVVREGGRTVVWIASDDNQSMLQRSLLLKFALDPAL